MQNGGDKSSTDERTKGRTRPSKRKCLTFAPTPAPKRKKTSVPLASPVAGIAPALVSPRAGIGAYTTATPWPARRELPKKIISKELRTEDRINYVSDLKQGLGGGNKHPDAFLKNFAIFEYVGIVGTPGQRRRKGDNIYDDADKMITGISKDLYRRNLGKFFGGFIGLDVIIHKNLPDSYRIVHQLFCGTKTDVDDLTQRLYHDKRLCLIVCMTGQDHVPDTHMNQTVNGCFLREGVKLNDFALNVADGVPSISHCGGSTYGAAATTHLRPTSLRTANPAWKLRQVMPTPRRPTSGRAFVQATPATALTKPQPTAPRKGAENKDILEVKFISGISCMGKNLQLVGFKPKDYLAIYNAMTCFIPAGLTEDSTVKAVQHLRNVTERVKLGCVEQNASIRPLRPFELNDFSKDTNDF